MNHKKKNTDKKQALVTDFLIDRTKLKLSTKEFFLTKEMEELTALIESKSKPNDESYDDFYKKNRKNAKRLKSSEGEIKNKKI